MCGYVCAYVCVYIHTHTYICALSDCRIDLLNAVKEDVRDHHQTYASRIAPGTKVGGQGDREPSEKKAQGRAG